ncbi:MAG: ExbD/TolR family protein [Sphingobacteriaceae bacterium]
MPRVKIARKSTAIDMTAMCDVAFLLLTFFILTSKFKTEDPVPVDIPASTTMIKLPESEIATITIAEGKVFFGVEGFDVRKDMLVEVGKRYNIAFTKNELERFAVINSFGLPIGNMKQFINMEPEQRVEIKQPGIPTDSTDNQLHEWVIEARRATKRRSNKELRIAIKGDSKEEYPTVKRVIDILQKQKVNKFSLITSLKGVDK